MKETVIEFTRVSSHLQKENGSLETQSMNCISKLKELKLFDKYDIINCGGVVESAKTGGRTFQDLESMAFNSSNKVKIVIVSQMDRLSRNSKDGKYFVAKLHKEGVHLISADGKVNTLESIKDYDEAMRLIQVAEEDNEAKAYRTVNGNHHQLIKGRWIANPPFGYTKFSKYEFVPNENAHFITTLFDMFLQGFSMTQIRLHFKSKGLVKSKSTISDWIRNPFFCGRLEHKSFKNGEEYVIGNHEPIVSPYVFDLVQAMLRPYNKRECLGDVHTPLKKVLKCNCCGSNMTSYPSSGFYYYRCNNTECNNHFSAEMAHNALFDVVGSIEMDLTNEQIEEVITELYEEYYSSDMQIRRNKEQQLKKIILEKETYVDTCLSTGFEFVSQDMMREKVNSYNKQIDSIHEVISKLNSTTFDEFKEEQLSMLTSLGNIFKSADYEQKQDTLSVIFDGKIEFNKKTEQYQELNLSPLFILAA